MIMEPITTSSVRIFVENCPTIQRVAIVLESLKEIVSERRIFDCYNNFVINNGAVWWYGTFEDGNKIKYGVMIQLIKISSGG